MKKLLLSLFSVMLVGAFFIWAATSTVTFDTVSDETIQLVDAADGVTVDGLNFTATQNDGSSKPLFFVNLTGASPVREFRIYAKNTVTVKSLNGNMTKLVFNVSNLKRLGAVTASAGTVAEQASGDQTVTWTGDAAEVSFTVGDKAVYGTESSKAAQFCFNSVEVTVGEGGETPVDPVDPPVDPVDPPVDPVDPAGSGVVAYVAQGAEYTGAGAAVELPTGNVVGDGVEFKSDACTISWTKVNSSNSQVTGSAVRWYQNDILSIVPAAGVTITKVAFTGLSGYSNNTTAVLTATADGQPAELEADGVNRTWTGSTNTAFTITNSKQYRFTVMEVTYSKGGEIVVNAPVVAMSSGNTVEITCATEGAAIHYTEDGTEPDAESTLYTAPFTISTPVTVKAVAVLDGKLSAVTTAECEPNTVASLAELLAKADRNRNIYVDAPLSVVYQNGGYLYVVENGTPALVYGSVDRTYANGDIVPAGAGGKYTVYNDLVEIVPDAASFGEPEKGEPVAPKAMTASEITADMQNTYVQLTGATVAADGSNATANDASGSIALYNRFGLSIENLEGATVSGFVAVFKGSVQLYPVEITGGQVEEQVAAPEFSPASGELSAGDLITITCATEGASIYYTTDDSEPTAESTLYTEPIAFTADVTVKAVAMKEGMAASEVVTAAYVLKSDTPVDPDDRTEVDEFDFSAPTGLTPAVEPAAEASNGVNIAGNTYTNGKCELAFGENEAKNKARIWTKTDGSYELRAYGGDKMTFTSLNPAYRIIKIELTSATWGASNNFEPASATADEPKTWTSTDGSEKVILTIGAKTFITKAVVTMKVTSAVDDIAVDTDNAPVEYYNLNGVRVAESNLTSGLYIRRQGAKATKVVVK